jgi:predicted neuraminidase
MITYLFSPRLLVLLVAFLPALACGDEADFLQPPRYIGRPQTEHASTNRAFQGIPSLAVSPAGRLWATWYAGKTPGEDSNNYVVLSTSSDDGKSWQEVLVVDPDGEGPVRTFDPEVWIAPDGKLRLFWAQARQHEASVGGVWYVIADNPEVADPMWGPAVRATEGVMMCKPIVLSTGEWVLPASTWRKTDDSAKMVVSTDRGKTWSVRGAANVPAQSRQFDEHMFVERRDGSLWMLVRTNYGIGESVSLDRGATWPEVTPSSIAHPSARFFITRLNSGNLLLVKHGEIEQAKGRSHLTAFLSADDGATWTGGLLLDERNGVSYPDGQQSADGTIRIIYDFSRTGSRHILVASFDEADVAAGRPVSDRPRLRQLVSEATGGLEKAKGKE